MNEWWTEIQAGWIGGVVGAAVGVLGGCFGALAGYLVKHGRAERFVIGGMASSAGAGAAALGVGLVAVVMEQPWHVWYPFTLLGLILVFTTMPMMFAMRRSYEQVGARRLEAELLRTGAERGERAGGTAGVGFIFTAVIAAAIVSGGAMAAAIAALHERAAADDAAGIADVQAKDGRDFTLDNGARVTLLPAPGVGCVAVVAAYGAGFLEDDAGAAQIAHLVEHLRITNATASYGQGESQEALNTGGAANAETVAHFVYYDHTGPPERLREMLQIEYERLTSLVVEQSDIEREAPRCAAEVEWVARRGGVALQKFATMAAAQGWRSGHDHASVREAIGEITAAQASRFIESHYGPQRLHLYVVGDFEEDAARELIDGTIGRTPRNEKLVSPVAIDWSAQPTERRMTWDTAQSCAMLAWPAPEDPVERIAMTFFGMALSERVARTPNIGGMPSAMASSVVTPVGALPFHIFVAPVGEESIEEAVERIEGELADMLRRGVRRGVMRQMLMTVQRLSAVPSAAQARIDARQLADAIGVEHERAVSMVIGQSALNRHSLRTMSGGDRNALDEALRLDESALNELARRLITPERRFITILTPSAPADEQGGS